jgi:hypothetical protein
MPLGVQSSALLWPILSFLSDIAPVVPRRRSSINRIQSKSVPWAMIKGSRLNGPRAARCMSARQIEMRDCR